MTCGWRVPRGYCGMRGRERSRYRELNVLVAVEIGRGCLLLNFKQFREQFLEPLDAELLFHELPHP